MTTEYRDKDGNLVRTDYGTKPRSTIGRQAAKPASKPADKAAPAAATKSDATASKPEK
jgi:hypothetical protein